MMTPVIIEKRSEIDMRVTLSRREPSMAQHLLDGSQIRASSKKMSREAVPEPVRRQSLGRCDSHQMLGQNSRDAS